MFLLGAWKIIEIGIKLMDMWKEFHEQNSTVKKVLFQVDFCLTFEGVDTWSQQHSF